MNRLAHLGPAPLKATILSSVPRHVPSRTRFQSLRDALEGLREAWSTQPNLRFHAYAGVAVTVLGVCLRLSLTEWLWVTFAIGLVIFAELMNTSIEQTVDLVVGLRPDPLARQVKDLAAGCVLIAAVLAVVIGAFTFLPHLVTLARWHVGT